MTHVAGLRHRHVLTLPTVPRAVTLARETAQQVYPEWGITLGHPVMGPALLVLSELMTNSVRHAARVSPHTTVTYAAGADVLAFAVHDRDPRLPDLVRFTVAGGGLPIVAEVTAELGGTCTVRRDADGGGKSVWVTLPL